MKTKSAVSLTLLVLFALANTAYAEKPDVRLSAGIGYLQGDTTYQIGGHVTSPQLGDYDYHFPISELTWPLDVYIVSGNLAASYWRLSGNISYKTNISGTKGKMQDSDWVTISAPDQLDIYSESKEDVDVKIFNGDISIAFLKGKGWDLNAGGGYMQQDFDFSAKDTVQWYPSNPTRPADSYSGKTITYEATYKIPYLLIGTNFNTKRFHGNITYSYSPWVNAEDNDNHLLRKKVSKGYSDGSMHNGIFRFNYDFAKHWFAGFSFDYLRIDTKGYQRQHQSQYFDYEGKLVEEFWADIDNEILSEQITTMLSAGFKF